MATNPLFNNFNHAGEQRLLEECIIEAIKIFGINTYYMPRVRNNFEGISYQDDMSSFESAYLIEMYPNDTMGFTGKGTLYGALGLEIRDQIKFTVAKRIFDVEVTSEQPEILRPREGDLIYFPLNDLVFEIKFVENKPFFFQLGNLPTFEMTCELFEYSNEQFNTGIEVIDAYQQVYSIDSVDYSILLEDGSSLVTEQDDYMVLESITDTTDEFDPLSDNDRIDDFIEDNDSINFDESDPFSETGRY